MILSGFIDVIRKWRYSHGRCVCHGTARFYRTASIVNNLGRAGAIRVGAYTHIRGELLTFGHGGAIDIGDYCYVGANTHIWSGKSIRIGNRVLISHNCNLFDNDTHPLNPGDRHAQFLAIITTGQPRSINLNDEEIVIEDDALIGANAIILKGVRIGRGAVIGAGSVVIRDVAPFTVVAGNPAEVVRELPPEDRI
jgi:acetyltransferase-like isoleucine patch superfamily enzyme